MNETARLWNWFRKSRAPAPTEKRANRPFKRTLILERLEERLLLSSDPIASVSVAGVLEVMGTDGADQMVVRQSGVAEDGGVIIDFSSGTLNAQYGTAQQGIQRVSLHGLGGADSFTLVDVTAPVDIDGGDGDDTVRGADVDNHWFLSALGAGTLNNSIAFTGIENLQGGSRADVFGFADQASITGTLDGALGANALDYSAYQSAIAVDLGQGTATGTAQALNVGDLIGGAGIDTLTGADAAAVWIIDDADGGEIQGVLAFAGIENLVGAAGLRDEFVIEVDGSLSGMLDGGSGGADALVVYNPSGDAYSIVNAKTGTGHTVALYGKTLRYGNLEPIVDAGAVDAVAYGSVMAEAWQLQDIDATTMALVSTSWQFYDDTVATPGLTNTLQWLKPSQSLTLRLGDGNDSLALMAMTGALSSIVVHGGDGDDVLSADTTSDLAWSVTAAGAGTVSGLGPSVAFSDLDVLVGGSGDDAFVFANDAASIGGGIDGGTGGTDTLDFGATTRDVTVMLGAGNDNIDAVIGGAGSNTLVGVADDNTWTIDSADNAGRVVTTRHSTTALDATTQLDAAADTLRLPFAHGLVDGQAVTYRSTLVGAADTSGLVDGATYYVRVIDDKTIGLSPTAALATTIDLQAAAWSTPGSTSTLDQDPVVIYDVSFSSFENLSGHGYRDDFVFTNGGSLTGTLLGGGGVDTLDYTGFGSAVTVDLGAGASSSAARIAGFERITGSTAGADTLRGPDRDSLWEITGPDAGTVGAVRFAGFEYLTGADNVDDGFTVHGSGSVSGQIAGGDGGVDGLRVLDPADATSGSFIVPDGGGVILQGSVYAGISALLYTGIEIPLRVETVGNDVNFYGSPFQETLRFTQSGSQLTLAHEGSSFLFWSSSGGVTGSSVSAALPTGTVSIVNRGADIVSIGRLEMAGANLDLRLGGDSAITFTGDIDMQGGDLDVVAGANSDGDGLRGDRGSIVVQSNVFMTTRQTALPFAVSGVSLGPSGDIRFLSGAITLDTGAALETYNEQEGTDPAQMPAGITAQTSPADGWSPGVVYRDVATTGGTGTGLSVDVVVDTDGQPTVTLRDPGTDYTHDDLITIAEPGAFATGSAITVRVDGLLGKGGDITLLARDQTFAYAYDPNAIAEARIAIHGATLFGRNIVIRAEADNDVLFGGDDTGPVERGPTAWFEKTGQALAEALADLFLNLRVLGGYARSTAVADVTVDAGAAIYTRGGGVVLDADAYSEANVITLGLAWGASYVRSDATAAVTLADGASIFSSGDVVLGAVTGNTVSANTKTLNSGALAKVPLSLAVTVAEGYQQATTTVGLGTTIVAGGDVDILAHSTRVFEAKAEGSSKNQSLGIGATVALSDAGADAIIDGSISAANGDIRVTAQTTSTKNSSNTKFQGGEATRSNAIDRTVIALQTTRFGVDVANGDDDAAGAVAGLLSVAFKSSGDAKINAAVKKGGELPAPEKGKSLGAIAATYAQHEAAAHATFGAASVVDAGGDVRLRAGALDRPDINTQGLVAVFNDPSKPRLQGAKVYGLALSFGDYANSAVAVIASGARVDAAGAIRVDARTRLPYETPWDDVRKPGQAIGVLVQHLADSNLGAAGYVSSWTQSQAQGNKVGRALSAGILVLDSAADARIGSGARINQSGLYATPGDVSVTARTDLEVVSLAGNFKNIIDAAFGQNTENSLFGNSGSKGGVGGSFVAGFYDNTATAVIESGALVDATNLRVDAQTVTNTISLGVSGGKASDSAVNGVLNLVTMNNRTLARIGAGAVIDAGAAVDVTANDDAFNLNIAGAVSIGKSLGFGMTVGTNVINRDTRALIGNRAVGLGAAAPNVGVDSAAEAIDLGYVHGMLTGDVVRYSDGGSDTPIGGLVDGDAYVVRRIDATTVALARSNNEALQTDGFGAGAIDSAADQLTLAHSHGFQTGDRVVYRSGGGADVGGLVDGQSYVVIRASDTSLQLAQDAQAALDGDAIDLDTAAYPGSGNGHTLRLDLDGAGALGEQHNLGRVFAPAGAVDGASGDIDLGYAHGFITGQALMYSHGGGESIGGLANKNLYYAVVVDATTIRLADSRENALHGVTIELDASVAEGEQHAIGAPLHAVPRVDNARDTIGFDGAHAYYDGQALVYDNGGGTSIGGLVDDNGATVYYAKVIGATHIALHTDTALNNRVDLNAALASGSGHSLSEAADSAAGGSFSAVGKTTVAADNTGLVVTATLAAAKTDDKPDPKADANAQQAAGGQKHGRAVSGSVSVNLLDDSLAAGINGATFTRSGGLDVRATNNTHNIAVSGAAALSTNRNGSLGLAGAVTVNLVDAETLAYVSNTSLFNVGAVTVNADASGDLLAIAAGLAGSARGTGIAGSIAYNTLDTRTAAWIDNGASVSGSSLFVGATDSSGITAVAGAIAYGGQNGFGAGIAINRIDGGAQAFISGADVDVTGTLSVLARNDARITSVAAGIAVAVATPAQGDPPGTKVKGFAAAVGVSVNTIDANTQAGISDTGANTITAGGNVSLQAVDQSRIEGIAGGVAIGLASGQQSGALGAAAGASFVYNNLDRDVSAYADDASIVAGGDVALEAEQVGNILALAIGGAVAGSMGSGVGSSAGIAGAGALAMNTVRGKAESRLRRSQLTTTGTGDVLLRASDDATITADAGGVAFSLTLSAGTGSGGSLSIGAALAFNDIDGGNVRALVDDSTVNAAGTITLDARATGKIDALTLAGAAAVGASTGGGGAAISGAGAYADNRITRTVEASVIGSAATLADPAQNVRAAGAVSVAASDDSTITAETYGFSIGVGASAGTGAGGALSVGASLAYNTVDTRVLASIQDSDVQSVSGAITLAATSTSVISAESVAASVAAGYGSSSSALALSGGGAYARNTVLGSTNAFASGSDLQANGVVTLSASSTARIDATVVAASVSAALSPTRTAGGASVGAAFARNDIGWNDGVESPLEVRAYLANTDVTTPTGALSLTATANQVIDATVGAASVAVAAGRNGIGLGGAGADSINRISENVQAGIDGGAIRAGTVSVRAIDSSTITADAGAAAIAAAFGATGGVALSVGVALAENRIANQVTASVAGATVTTLIGGVVVSAETTASIDARTGAAAVGIAAGAKAGVAVSGAGASALNIILSRTVAEIRDDAVVESAGHVDLDARSNATIDARVLAASETVSAGGTAGVGASVGFALARNFIGWDPDAAVASSHDSDDALASVAAGTTVRVLDGVRAGDVYRFIGDAPALVYDVDSTTGNQTLVNTKDKQTRVRVGDNVHVWSGLDGVSVNLGSTDYSDTDNWRLERVANLAGQDFGDSDLWQLVLGGGTSASAQVQARILGASVDAAGDLTLDAVATGSIDARVAASSVAIAAGGKAGAALSGAGVGVENRARTEVSAFIDGSSGITANDIRITADDTLRITSSAGAASVAGSAAGSAAVAISVGMAVAYNEISDTVAAFITQTDPVSASGDIVITAHTNNTILAYDSATAVAASVAGTAGIALSGAGAIASNVILSSTHAYVDDSRIVAANRVTLDAENVSTITATVAALAVAVGGGGTVGAGVSIGASAARNFIGYDQAGVLQGAETRAWSRDSAMAASGDLTIGARANETITAEVLAGSVAVAAGGTAGLAAAGAGISAVNRIANHVAATIDGDGSGGIHAGAVHLSASDTSTITADGGATAVAVSFAGGGAVALAIGVALAENTIANQVETSIVNAGDLRATTGDVTLDATESNRIDAKTSAAAAAAAVAPAGAAISGGLATAVNSITSTTRAFIGTGSQVQAQGLVRVAASDTATIDAEILSEALAAGLVSVAVGLASSTNSAANTVAAYIAGADVRASGGTIAVTAQSNPTITTKTKAQALSVGFGDAEAKAQSSTQIDVTTEAWLQDATLTAIGNDVRVHAISTSSAAPETLGASGGLIAVSLLAADAEIRGATRAYLAGTTTVDAATLDVLAQDTNAATPVSRVAAAGAITISKSTSDITLTRVTEALVRSGAVLTMNSGSLAINAASTSDALGAMSSSGVGAITLGNLTVTATIASTTRAVIEATTTVSVPGGNVDVRAQTSHRADAKTSSSSIGAVSFGTSDPKARITATTEAMALGDIVGPGASAGAINVRVTADGNDASTAGSEALSIGLVSVGSSVVLAETAPTVTVRGGGAIRASGDVAFVSTSVGDADASSKTVAAGAVAVTSLDATARASTNVTTELLADTVIDAARTITISASHGTPPAPTADGQFNAATQVDLASETIELGLRHGLLTGDSVTYDAQGGTAIGGLAQGRSYGVIKATDSALQLGTAFQSAAVDTATDTLTFNGGHKLSDGDRVIYQAPDGAGAVGGLTSGATYVVSVLDTNTIKLVDPATALVPPVTLGGADVSGDTITLAGHGFGNGQALTYRAPPAIGFGLAAVDVVGGAGVDLTQADNDNIYLGAGHGLVAGDEVIYAAASGSPISGLVTGNRYFVILDAARPDEIRLAASRAEALGDAGDIDATPPVPATPITAIALARSTNAGDANIALSLRRIADQALGGLVDGQTYYAIRLDTNTLQLATDATLATSVTPIALDAVSGQLLDGSSTLGTEGVDLSAAGGGQLVLDLDSVGSGTQLFGGVGGARALIAAPSGDGIVTASASGSGGGLVQAGSARTAAENTPTVLTIIGNGADLSGQDISVTGTAIGNASASSATVGGGLAAIGDAQSSMAVDSTGRVSVGSAKLSAERNLGIISDSTVNASVLASSIGGGLVALSDADVTADVAFASSVDIGAGANLRAGKQLDVASRSATTVDASSYVNSAGLGSSADTSALLTIGTSTDRATTSTTIASGASVRGTTVSVTAGSSRLLVNASSHGVSGGAIADAEASAPLDIFDAVQVTLAANASVIGDSVTLSATHGGVALRSYANADTDGLYADADALARIQYDSINAVTVAAGARVTAVDLNVVSTQAIDRYDRHATADVDVFGDETVGETGDFLAQRTIAWNGDLLMMPGASPELVIAADGTVVIAKNASVNGGIVAGGRVTGATITVDPIINTDTGGLVQFTANALAPREGQDAPDGSIAGSGGSFTAATGYAGVSITNASDKALVVNAIRVANAAVAPRVSLDAATVTLEFAVGSGDVSTEVSIENLQTADLVLNGLIDNPIGLTRIVSGGNIASSGGAGVVRSNRFEATAQGGSIGLSANERIRVEAVQAGGLDAALAASASGDIHLDLTVRVRDTDAANNRFNIDALDAGGDVDLLLRSTLQETAVAGTLGDLSVDVVQEGLLAGYTRYFRPDTGPAGAVPLDLRVFATTAQAAAIDGVYDFAAITAGGDIAIVAASRLPIDRRLDVIARTDAGPSGDLRVLTNGDITIHETAGDLRAALIASSAGNVTLTAQASGAGIVDAQVGTDGVADVSGNTITLSASGGIGGANDVLEIDSSVQATGVLHADANAGIFVTEVQGALRLADVVSRLSDVALRAQGDILDGDGGVDDTDVQGRNIDLLSSTGRIGSTANSLEIYGAGTDQTDHNERLSPIVPAAGRLVAKAVTGIDLTEVNGALVVLEATTSAGALRLAVRDSALTIENLTLATGGAWLDGQAISSGRIAALGGAVELDVADDFLLPAGASIRSDVAVHILGDTAQPDNDPTNGAVITVMGAIDAPTVLLQGGGNIDFIQILGTTGINAGGTTTINAGAADDRIFVQAVAGAMTVNGDDGADRVYVSSDAARTVFTGGGFYNDDNGVDPLALLSGDLTQVNAELSFNPGLGGNGGTRDAIYLGASGHSTALTSGMLQGGAITGLGNTAAIRLATGASTALLIGLTDYNDRFQVADAGATLAVYVHGGEGDDTLNVGSAGNSLAGIGGIVAFLGEGGTADTLNVFGNAPLDATNPGQLTAIGITGMQMGSNTLGSIHNEIFGAGYDDGLPAYPGAIYYATRTVGTVESVNVQLGGGDDVFNVDSLRAGVTATVRGGAGDDTLTVRTTPTGLTPLIPRQLDGIAGNLLLDGEADFDTVELDDSGEDVDSVGSFLGNTVSGLGITGTVTLAPAEAINVLLGLGDDSFYIPAIAQGLAFTLHMGTGSDTVYLGTTQGNEASGTLSNIQGLVTINGAGPESGDRLFFNDQDAPTGQTYTVANTIGAGGPITDMTTLTRTGAAVMAYQRFEDVTLNAGQGADQIRLFATHREQDEAGGAASRFAVNAGGGNDRITIGRPVLADFVLDGFIGGIPVVVDGQGGDDTLRVRDDASTANTVLGFGRDPSGAYDAVTVAREGAALAANLRWVGLTMETVDVALGSGDDNTRVTSGNYQYDLNVDGGAGKDSLRVDNAVDMAGHTLVFSGGEHDDLVLVDLSMASIVDAGLLRQTVARVDAAGAAAVPQLAQLAPGEYAIEVQLLGADWQFRLVDAVGDAVTIAAALGGDATAEWQNIADTGAGLSLDTERGFVIIFAADPALYSAGAAQLRVGSPDSGLNLEFNGGGDSIGGAGDVLRIIGDGVATGAEYRPSATLAHAGMIIMGGSQIDFTGVEPLVIHGLPDFRVVTPHDPADLVIDGIDVDALNIGLPALHIVTVDGVISWSQQAKPMAIDKVADLRQFAGVMALHHDFNGSTLVIGAERRVNGQTLNAGMVLVYDWDNDQSRWVETARLTAPDANAAGSGSGFGKSVAVSVSFSSGVIVVGAPNDSTRGYDAGAAYAFVKDGTGWAFNRKFYAASGGSGDQFGAAVAASGSVFGSVLVGAPGAGEAHFFEAVSHRWIEGTVIDISAATGSGRFGYAVALEGGTAVIGNPDADNGVGAALVYTLGTGANSESVWNYATKLTPSEPVPANSFLYTRPDGQDDLLPGERFGTSVAIDGSRIVVGAPDWTDRQNTADLTDDQVEQGRAFVFDGSGAAWTLVARLTADGGLPVADASSEGKGGDHFGTSVALDGAHVVVGAPDVDGGVAIDAGAAYVFVELPDTGSGNGPSWARASGAPVNGQVTAGKLVAERPAGADAPSGAPLADHFGQSVVIGGGRIVAGIPGFNETHAATIADVNVSLDITHTWNEDVQVTLIGPDGTEVLLIDQIGGSSDNFTGTVLDDEAANAISSAVAPFTGVFRPQNALAAFDGASAAGTWTLRVADDFPGFGGTLNAWSLRFTFADGSSRSYASIDGVVAISEDGAPPVLSTVGVEGGSIRRADVGSIRTFEVSGVATSVASAAEVLTSAQAQFGSETLYDKNSRTLFVASPGAGIVDLYVNEGLYWRPNGSLFNYAGFEVLFGAAMDIDGKTLVVGAPGSDIVYTYDYNDIVNTWAFVNYVQGQGAGGQFGAAVAIDGDRIAVGAPAASVSYASEYGPLSTAMSLGTSGAVFTYTRSPGGTTWSFDRMLMPDDAGLPASSSYSSIDSARANKVFLTIGGVEQGFGLGATRLDAVGGGEGNDLTIKLAP